MGNFNAYGKVIRTRVSMDYTESIDNPFCIDASQIMKTWNLNYRCMNTLILVARHYIIYNTALFLRKWRQAIILQSYSLLPTTIVALSNINFSSGTALNPASLKQC